MYSTGNNKRPGAPPLRLDPLRVTASRRLLAFLRMAGPGAAEDVCRESRVAPKMLASRRRYLLLELLIPLMVAVAYITYQRVGTVANANLVEFTPNLAGGFVAVAMTDTQPGFVILSSLNRKRIDVSAERVSNRFSGTHTVADIRTPSTHWVSRLRRPQVVLVNKDGRVDAFAVDWSYEDFSRIREAIDCSAISGKKHQRCGMPFMDLNESLAKWPGHRVPAPLSRFLASALTAP